MRARPPPEAKKFVLIESVGRHYLRERWAAFRQRSGLVDDASVDLFQTFEGFGVLDEYAESGTAADSDHDRHWGGQAERAGAGDDQLRRLRRIEGQVRGLQRMVEDEEYCIDIAGRNAAPQGLALIPAGSTPPDNQSRQADEPGYGIANQQILRAHTNGDGPPSGMGDEVLNANNQSDGRERT